MANTPELCPTKHAIHKKQMLQIPGLLPEVSYIKPKPNK
jgi:hypothetical protein